MAKTYDTTALRITANNLAASAEAVGSTSQKTLAWVRDDAPDQIMGEAASALEERVDEIHRELTACSRELFGIGSLLRRYAMELDEADAKAAAMIEAE